MEVKDLYKKFKTFELQKISFNLERGKITGFMGTNGSGKTTTIKLILGLMQKNSGSIKIFGQELEKNESLIKQRIGVVFDGGYFYDKFTIGEMKSIVAPAYKNWSDKTFDDYMDEFGLLKSQKIETLSKGMKMKFAIALALSHDAQLLIMDEPTSGLDPQVRNEITNIFMQVMKDKSKAIFYSTHITSDLDKTADNIILINKGQIILSGSKESIIRDYKISHGVNEINLEDIMLSKI